MVKPELQLSDEEAIEFSKLNPNEAYIASDGKIVYQGILFKDEKEFKGFINILKSMDKPAVRFLVKMGASFVRLILWFRKK